MDKKAKLSSPIIADREAFIYGTRDVIKQDRVQTITFTLNKSDIEILESQVDRAISLNMRNKNKSTIIRMALRALERASDDTYITLYNEFK